MGCLPPARPALVGVSADTQDPGHGSSAAAPKQARATLPEEVEGGRPGQGRQGPEEAGLRAGEGQCEWPCPPSGT